MTRRIVQCSKGHLFSTIWIAGASLKAIRLGGTRLQWCPVGRHFAATRTVDPDTLTAAEAAAAVLAKDLPIP